MPFSIEIGYKSGVLIKLQVVKNILSLYFKGKSTRIDFVKDNWFDLENRFIKTIPEYKADWTRGSDTVHIKTSHTNEYEVDVEHYHAEFNSEVTPQIFATYLKKFFEQQKDRSEHYRFFINIEELNTTIEKYRIYYNEYKGSNTEELYQQQTKLTDKEELEYIKAVSASDVDSEPDAAPGVDAAPGAIPSSLSLTSVVSGYIAMPTLSSSLSSSSSSSSSLSSTPPVRVAPAEEQSQEKSKKDKSRSSHPFFLHMSRTSDSESFSSSSLSSSSSQGIRFGEKRKIDDEKEQKPKPEEKNTKRAKEDEHKLR